MAKIGEDWDGLRRTSLKNLGEIFQDALKNLSSALTILVSPARDFWLVPVTFTGKSADHYPVLRKLIQLHYVNWQRTGVSGHHGNTSLFSTNSVILHVITQEHTMNVVSGYRLPNNPDNGRAHVESAQVRRREAGNYKMSSRWIIFGQQQRLELSKFSDKIERSIKYNKRHDYQLKNHKTINKLSNSLIYLVVDI